MYFIVLFLKSNDGRIFPGTITSVQKYNIVGRYLLKVSMTFKYYAEFDDLSWLDLVQGLLESN